MDENSSNLVTLLAGERKEDGLAEVLKRVEKLDLPSSGPNKVSDRSRLGLGKRVRAAKRVGAGVGRRDVRFVEVVEILKKICFPHQF
jgi:hypothetical protein